jgi:hypothetical protein
MTLIQHGKRQEVPLTVDYATPGGIALRFQIAERSDQVRVTLYPDGSALLEMELAAGETLSDPNASVVRRGTILSCTGTDHSATIVVEVEAVFNWSRPQG